MKSIKVAGLGLLLSQTINVYAAENRLIDDASLSLGSLVVSSDSTGPLTSRNLSTSVDVLNQDRIEDQNVNYTWQLFDQMPGVMLTQFGMGNESGKISFRGFNGEGEVNAVKLLIDGIPSNQNSGNMPYLELLTPLEIESIEVVRGTNDPRYGLHNIAGNAGIFTHQGGNYNKARVTYGSYATRNVQFVSGIENNGFSQNYAISYLNSNRYRHHSDIEKSTFSGKWFYTPNSGRAQVGLIVRHGKAEGEEAGYLTRAEAHDDPEQSRPHNKADGGDRMMTQFSAHLDIDITDNLFWTSKAYLNELDEDRYVTFAAGGNHNERLTEEEHKGALTTLTWRPDVSWAHEFSLMGGLSAEWQNNESRRYIVDLDRNRTSETRNQNFDFDIYGGFIQAIYKPTEKLKIVPAFRVDTVRGSLNDNGTHRDINDYGNINQPKLSAVYSFNDQYAVYTNWGKTFQVASGAASYKQNTLSNDLDASINEGWEVGLKFTPTDWLNGRVAVWQQVADGEFKTKLGDANNDSENIGKTQRRGIDFQFNAQATDKLGLWFAASFQDSEILKAGADKPLNKGNEIDHVPHYLIDAGADYQATPKLTLSSWVSAQDDAYLNQENNTNKYGQYVLVNASASYALTEKVRLDLELKNIFDRYYEYVWMNSESMHSPGDGRSIYGSIQYDF
ncbi:TonB-dependent receptor [Methylophaga sp.]|uniref:TonB-dependent receptor n=1 Tax=Methylophaga sp. TaxID=2024840 RepID=UPI003A8DD66E